MSPLSALFRKDMRRYLGDRRALFINISLPFLLTLIMGLSFGGGIFGQGGGISAIPLALVGGDLPEMLKDNLAEGLRESGFFEVAWVDSLTADAQVRQGKVAAAVVLPPSLVESFFSLEPVQIEVWKDPASPLKSGIVEQILNRGLRQYQAGEAAYFGLWPEGQRDGWGGQDAENFERLFSGNVTDIWKTWRDDPDDPGWAAARERMAAAVDRHMALQDALAEPVLELKVHDKAPVGGAEQGNDTNLFNYFLPSFSVFFLMFGTVASARDLHREKLLGTLNRQRLSPAGRGDVVLGKWLAATFQGAIMLAFLFVAGGLAFQVNLGPDPFSLVTMIVLCCSAASAFFLLLAQATRSEKIMDNIGTIVVLVSALIGGNMIPVDTMPSIFHVVGRVGFNYWANLGFSDIMVRNQGILSDPLPGQVLLAMTVLFLGLNMVLARAGRRMGVWA